jgi:serine/threonine protein kinase/tetratricopeptide (TPR) repeat protein
MKPEQWQQVEQLYHAALELPADERAKFIAAACADDAALRREIETLLACDEQADQFLEKPAKEVIAGKMASLEPQSLPLLPGQRLSSYEIRSLLGAGGMGEVYLAHDLKLGRDVALKLLPDYLARDPERIRRFEREARVLASLSHPNIAAIYDLEQAGERRFLVLELVDGPTLAERLSKGPLTTNEALPLFRQIAVALQAAHDKGVIHRDLKPANIKITPEGSVKVLDFGMAKTLRPAFATSSAPGAHALIGSPTISDTLTREGMILGTVAYMSPEQARGREQQLDQRTDLWAFGCVLYEALTGRQPFRGETISDTLGAILSEEPDWRALPKPLPVSLQYLLRQCLAKELDERLPSATEAIRVIDQSITRQVTPLAFLRLLRKRVAPVQHRLITSIAAALLIVTSFAGWKEYRHRSLLPARKKLVVMDFRNESGRPEDRAYGIGLSQSLRNRLLRVSGVQVFQLPAAEASLSTDPQQAARAMEAGLILTGTVTREGNHIHLTWNLSNDRWEMIDGAETESFNGDVKELLEQVAARVTWSLRLHAAARNETASTHLPGSSQADYLTALGWLREGLDDKAIALLEKLERSALVHAALGSAYYYKFRSDHESRWLRQAEEECLTALKLDAGLPEVKYTLGLIQLQRGQAAQAGAAFEEALQLDLNNPDLLLGMAAAYLNTGQPDKAEKTWLQAMQLAPGYWAVYNDLGSLYFDQGRYAEALRHWQCVAELKPDRAESFLNLGAAYFGLARLDDAVLNYHLSFRLRETPDAYLGLAVALYYQGHYAESAAAAEAGLKLNAGDPYLLGVLGDACHISGAEERSAGAYDQAIAARRASLRQNPDDGPAWSQLAEWLAKRGRTDEAVKTIEKALEMDSDSVDSLVSAVVVWHLAGNDREALRLAERAVSSGYSAELLFRDPVLSRLRQKPEFEQLTRQSRRPQ